MDLVRERPGASPFSWRTFPWHPHLHWVIHCRSLSAPQIEFLRRVHDGLVNGRFREPAPLKYRSLQLTGDEKLLASLATTSLFSESRLTLEMLACLPDALPLAWEAVGEGGRMVIFERFLDRRSFEPPGRSSTVARHRRNRCVFYQLGSRWCAIVSRRLLAPCQRRSRGRREDIPCEDRSLHETRPVIS